MTLNVANRVRELSTTTGAGTYDLDGAASNHQTFVAGIGDGNTCHYLALDAGGNGWEVGVGTITDAAPDTLARASIIASSNSDAAVNWSAGTRRLMCVWPGNVAAMQALIVTSGFIMETGAQIVAGAGSFGAPSVSFLNDLSTGFLNDGTGKIFISLNGNIAARFIDAGGFRQFQGNSSSSWNLVNTLATDTIANIHPEVGDASGVGRAGSSQPSWIAGNTEVMRGTTVAMQMQLPIALKSYTVATLPSTTATHFIYVSNETGGAIPAFADGSNFRRVSDRAIVS